MLEDTKQQEQNSKDLTPIYLSVVKLNRVMEIISAHNFSKVSGDTFMAYDLKKVDAMLAVNGLRFLGFLDNEGNATELMKKLRLTGDSRKQELEKIVRNAYAKLFSMTEAPQDLPTKELISALRLSYDLSERVATSAAPAFNRLAEMAGLKTETPQRRSSNKKTSSGKTSKTSPKGSGRKDQNNEDDADHTTMSFIGGKMLLQIEPDLMKESMLNDSNTQLTALIKAAQDYEDAVKKETPDSAMSQPEDS